MSLDQYQIAADILKLQMTQEFLTKKVKYEITAIIKLEGAELLELLSSYLKAAILYCDVVRLQGDTCPEHIVSALKRQLESLKESDERFELLKHLIKVIVQLSHPQTASIYP
jgi:hypothetical protein